MYTFIFNSFLLQNELRIQVPGLIDIKINYLVFIDVGMFYFYSLHLPFVTRVENAVHLTEKIKKKIIVRGVLSYLW